MDCKYCNEKHLHWKVTKSGVKRLYESNGNPHYCRAKTESKYKFVTSGSRLGELMGLLKSLGTGVENDEAPAVPTYALPPLQKKKEKKNSTLFKKKKKRYFNASTVINFGKHSGRTMTWLIRNEIGYVKWMVANFDDHFSDDIIRECNERR